MSLSLWEKESFFAPCDVVIAGSGFVGLWSACFLKERKPTLRITIVESGHIPAGASTRNAGFACYGSATELMKDVQAGGEDQMLSLVEMRYRGLKKITHTFSKNKIDYHRNGGYELLDTSDRCALEENVKWLNKKLRRITGERNIFRFADEQISKFGFSGFNDMIFTRPEGQLHSGKLCQLLLQKAASLGVTVIPSTEVLSYEASGTGLRVETNRGFSIQTEQLLICTNGFAKKLLPGLDIVPARGQVVVTAPISSLKVKGSFHYDEGFYYFRNVGNRLLLGGARNTAIEEETTTIMELSPGIQATLEDFIRERLLPGTPFEITDRWSGIMGLGPEKMPIIKKVSDNVYCAVRMSGMGVALAPVAGEKVAKMMR